MVGVNIVSFKRNSNRDFWIEQKSALYYSYPLRLNYWKLFSGILKKRQSQFAEQIKLLKVG